MSESLEPSAAIVQPDEIPVLSMIEPLPGFPDHQHFALVRLEDSGLVCSLRSVSDDVEFVVVAPHLFFPDYVPEIDLESVELLDVDTADDLLVLVLVNADAAAGSATANLLAPVVVNHRTRRALQVVLEGTELPLQAPIALS
ncbi:MAG: flagellar assembly protein FliW [Nocardioidaceae bacterium]